MFLEANLLFLSQQRKSPIQGENKFAGHMRTINKLNKLIFFNLLLSSHSHNSRLNHHYPKDFMKQRGMQSISEKKIFSWTLGLHVLVFSKICKEIPMQIMELFPCVAVFPLEPQPLWNLTILSLIQQGIPALLRTPPSYTRLRKVLKAEV